MTDGSFVVISFVREGGDHPVVVNNLLMHDQAGEFWDKLSIPLRETASIRDAEHADFDQGAARWIEAA